LRQAHLLKTTHLGRLIRTAYLVQQWSILYALVGINRIVHLIAKREPVRQPPQETREEIRWRFRALLERDLGNVEAGLYPKALLFQIPFGAYARALPKIMRDIPRLLHRMRTRNYQDLPREVDLARYPPYYRRNFHWQTDGYLSRRSAEMYDLTVELLFLGTADVMRRQIIPPISRFLAEEKCSKPCLLDVGCGTGRTLHQIATTHPDLRLFGVDLSPYYLLVAREVLTDFPNVSLVTENGEYLPFLDGCFDIVTSVYLFHELPQAARRRVIAEAYRVLRPGGLLLIKDSIQVTDSANLAIFMMKFAEDYHEPYYQDYIQNDLASLLQEIGFEIESIELHYVSKVFVARK
jgi:ubiquinone/menaquinone biosynthesis C-methylase UbiE